MTPIVVHNKRNCAYIIDNIMGILRFKNHPYIRITDHCVCYCLDSMQSWNLFPCHQGGSDSPASWCSPERCVDCSTQGWSPARSLLPVHQAREAAARGARRRLLPALRPPRPRGRLSAARASFFPGPQHRKTAGSLSAAPLPPAAISVRLRIIIPYPVLGFQNKLESLATKTWSE